MYSIAITHHKHADELLSAGDMSESFLLYEKSLKEYIAQYKIDTDDVRKREMLLYIDDAFKKAESIKKTITVPPKQKCRT